jgi:hypothetical protein
MKKLVIGLAIAIVSGCWTAAPAHAGESCIEQLKTLASDVAVVSGGQVFSFNFSKGSIGVTLPNDTFDPELATDDELKSFGFEPRPITPNAYGGWLNTVRLQSAWFNIDAGCSALAAVKGQPEDIQASHNANSWAGYVAISTYSVTGVSGSFYVPPTSLNTCSSGNQSVSIWVGIGGTGTNPLIQAGWVTLQTPQGTQSGTFWEVYPLSLIHI